MADGGAARRFQKSDQNWISNPNMQFLKLDDKLMKKVRNVSDAEKAAEILEKARSKAKEDAAVLLAMYSQLEQANKLAIKFIDEQTQTWRDKASFIQTALMLADKDYEGILGMTDSQKANFFDLLLNVALIVAPYLGPWADALKTWGDSRKDFKSKLTYLLSQVAQNTNDVVGAVQDYETIEGTSESLSKASSSREVIRTAMAEMYKMIGTVDLLASKLKTFAIKNQSNEEQIRLLWTQTGLSIINTETIAKSMVEAPGVLLNGLANTFLYDMLRNYAGKHCKYDADIGTAFLKSEAQKKEYRKLLTQDSDKHGKFVGMSEASRMEIYKRFGDSSKWMGQDSSRPTINGYRDMIDKWGVNIV